MYFVITGGFFKNYYLLGYTGSSMLQDHLLVACELLGFPAGSAVKNPPANSGDMGLIPGLGRSPMPRSN